MKVRTKIIAVAATIALCFSIVAAPIQSIQNAVLGNFVLSAAAASTTDGFVYTITSSKAVISGYTGTGGDITIPSAINGYPVIVGASAFKNNSLIRSVIISEGVSEIRALAFFNCTNLLTATLPSTTEVVAVNAFNDCNKAQFLGDGVPRFVEILATSQLASFGYTKDTNMTPFQKYQVMYDIAIKLRATFTYNLQFPHRGDAASVFNTLWATCGGFSRAYYHLGLAAGLTPNEIKVVGDVHCHAWNYVNIGGNWFNVDVTNNVRFVSDTQYSDFMVTHFGDISQHYPENWINVLNIYYGGGVQPSAPLLSVGTANYFRGDVDKNGKIEMVDALLISSYLAGNALAIPNSDLILADFNGDGVVDSLDISDILAKLVA